MKEHTEGTNHRYNFILCPSFHGASLLAILLNNHPQIVSLGDTAPTKTAQDFFCSCGSIIKDCGFWKSVHSTQLSYNHEKSEYVIPLLPNLETNTIERLNRLNEYFRRFLSPWLFFPLTKNRFRKSVELFTETALEFHGKNIFVDGTKDINRCLSIRNITNKEIRVIHLIRDPRGYLSSLRKNIPEENIDLKTASKMWKGFHYLALHLFSGLANCHYLPVYYENLASEPAIEMKRIFEFLGVPYHDSFQKPQLPHHIIGNRMIADFSGEIRQDIEWRNSLSPTDQAKVLEYCEPISSLLKYN